MLQQQFRGHVGYEHARAWLDGLQFLDPLRVLGKHLTYWVRGYSPTTITTINHPLHLSSHYGFAGINRKNIFSPD